VPQIYRSTTTFPLSSCKDETATARPVAVVNESLRQAILQQRNEWSTYFHLRRTCGRPKRFLISFPGMGPFTCVAVCYGLLICKSSDLRQINLLSIFIGLDYNSAVPAGELLTSSPC
jgi:hypothetical protein